MRKNIFLILFCFFLAGCSTVRPPVYISLPDQTMFWINGVQQAPEDLTIAESYKKYAVHVKSGVKVRMWIWRLNHPAYCISNYKQEDK